MGIGSGSLDSLLEALDAKVLALHRAAERTRRQSIAGEPTPPPPRFIWRAMSLVR